MGFDSQHQRTWSQLERRLSGVADPLADADGGDAPGFSRKREIYKKRELSSSTPEIPYAELHCHTNFSFLDGASDPEELVEEAVRLGLEALAITDHDGFYGVVRFAEAAREYGLKTVFGTELNLTFGQERAGQPDPQGEHLLLLARGHEGYARLSAQIARAHLRGGEKGRPRYDLIAMAEQLRGHVVVLTGCRKGRVRRALEHEGIAAARNELLMLQDLFGPSQVFVELTDHGNPLDTEHNDALATLSDQVIATNNVHYHAPARRKLATVMAAVRARTSLDLLDPYLPAAATAHLRSGDEMAVRLGEGPVRAAAALAQELAFDLNLIAPRLPPFIGLAEGLTEQEMLRQLALAGYDERYGRNHEALERIEHELRIIDELGYPGYFLVVWDLVRFCRSKGIYCQGRGSAANSAVCYALRITNVDPIRMEGLLFERFLAPERDGPPDIDIDIESDRREEVIQYVFDTYGREHTAQVANVISYRPRSAVRDVARAFGFSPGQQDAWSKQLDRWHGVSKADAEGVPDIVMHFANEMLGAPRHLGIHSGGMVICDRPVIEVVPVEHARMEKRTVLQWDKDDCAAINLVKFDLLGLGMLSALRYAHEFIDSTLDLGDLHPTDEEVYEMLCRADTVGVFQVESRAQMSTLPRLKPREFYDLVVEVALIRPGPIQGGSVHPFIRRKNGLEQWQIPHPLMANALNRTLGVPLFQEQMMQLAIDVASFTASDADQLRRAMGSKRSMEKMEKLRDKFYDGMAGNGITDALADDIFGKLAAFANYGFPESHAISFAYLVYASAWLKRYYPAAFCAALLGAQPMGFYSTQSLVDDARRHGVLVDRPHVNKSDVKATLEGDRSIMAGGARTPSSQWGWHGPSVRLGLDQVRTLGSEKASLIVTERANGDYRDILDFARRTQLPATALEALATADAFACFGLNRREALWAAGAAAQERSDRLPHTTTGVRAPQLPSMDEVDQLVADVWATGLSPDNHPIRIVREFLDEQGAIPISRLGGIPDGDRVLVGGLVTHRQRPATASGITFLNLEDETGMLNIVCTPGLWQRHRKVALSSAALLIRGKLENVSGVINVAADKLTPLKIATRPSSRDFR
ncbi:error-prone DNA polymerase [Catelliglobosispora koreensis]|uniref:error-prone DNA polymerase n=1 Tax=Catelliglobosispora koreensis TaxID=129052 RepID=UPI00037F4428|nr:error-prone DNA polymerase [Catelliglobosispora koreensis]